MVYGHASLEFVVVQHNRACFKVWRLPISDGMLPSSLLDSRNNVWRRCRSPMSEGIVPVSLFRAKFICPRLYSSAPRWGVRLGIDPPIWLCCPGVPAWWGRPWVRSGSEVLFNTSSCYKLVYETIFLTTIQYVQCCYATNTHFARLHMPFVLFFVQQIRSSSSEAQPRNQQGHVAPALIHSIWEVTSWVRW